jgi:2-oxo-4-hydroxy-4-carboxy--5-ureidoimidazoline (OHCU) decarboxylase
VSGPGGSLPWIVELDRLDPPRATAVLAPLFEGAARFLARLVAERPFWSWDRLFDRAREIAHAMPQPEQVELLGSHPRLGAASPTLSALSSTEQGHDRPSGRGAPPSPSSADTARLVDLNARYEARFGFRYCVFVAGRPLAALLPGFEAALAAERDAELRRGLDAVVDIAVARWRELAGPDGPG